MRNGCIIISINAKACKFNKRTRKVSVTTIYSRIIITSKYHDLIVYDHQEVILTNYDGFGIREKRAGYTKILQ